MHKRTFLALALLSVLLSLGRGPGATHGAQQPPEFWERSWDAVSLPRTRVALSAKVRELVRTIEVKEGQKVKKGTVLVKLDSRLLELLVARSEIETDFSNRIGAAQTRSELMRRELERKKKLGKYISESDLDKAQAEKKIAELDVRELRRQEELAKRDLAFQKERLKDYTITSPVDGVVSHIWVDVGEMVDEAQKIAEVIDPSAVEIRIHVPEIHLQEISIAKAAKVRFPAVRGKPVLVGKISYVSPYVDSGSGTLLVKILTDASRGAVRPGLACQVQFTDPKRPR